MTLVQKTAYVTCRTFGDSNAVCAESAETAILAHLLERLAFPEAVRWLDSPHPDLENQSPAALNRRGQKDVVLELLKRGYPLQHFAGSYDTEAPAIDPFDRLTISRRI